MSLLLVDLEVEGAPVSGHVGEDVEVFFSLQPLRLPVELEYILFAHMILQQRPVGFVEPSFRLDQRGHLDGNLCRLCLQNPLLSFGW